MRIEMKVSALRTDPLTRLPMVILSDPAGSRRVRLWIGAAEAGAIAAELERIRLDRPSTHDLVGALLGATGARLLGAELRDLRNGTLYADITLLRGDGTTVVVDARPSDAIALALRAQAPIYLAKKVLAKLLRTDPAEPEADPEPAAGATGAEPRPAAEPAGGKTAKSVEDVVEEAWPILPRRPSKWKM